MDVVSLQSNLRPDSATQVLADSPAQRAQRREVASAVKTVNDSGALGSDREMTLSIDRATREVVTKIVNTNTGEVLYQMPAEYALRMAEEYKQNA
jgi:uncharacterized FlaG/YvyC family protein